jgi:hypothetical protein
MIAIILILALLLGIAIGFIISNKMNAKHSALYGVISGKDSERFHKRMRYAENNPMPKEEVERIKAFAKRIIDKSNLN